jgi:hypothetical protein
LVDEFPEPNEELVFPAITVSHMTDAGYTAIDPYPLQDPPAPVNNQTVQLWVVGQWDYKIQVEIWSRNRPERDRLFAHFYQVFNKDIVPMGLRLPMSDYYGMIAEFDMDGFKHMDAEQASQRREWRTLVNLLVHTKEILPQSEFVITQPIVNPVVILDTVQSID